MDLNEFIKNALVQIVDGVAATREVIAKHGATAGSDAAYGTSAGKFMDGNGRLVSLVEFDIALAESTSTDTKGGIGVFLGAVNLGSQGASHGDTSSHSRIKFSVPVVYPGKGEE